MLADLNQLFGVKKIIRLLGAVFKVEAAYNFAIQHKPSFFAYTLSIIPLLKY